MSSSLRLFSLTCATLLALFVSVKPVGAENAPEAKETYEALSTHHTDAVYKGTINRPCLFRTALCPDRCNHGGTAAQFTITRYLKYQKPGKYGDAKTKEFSVMLKSPDTSQDIIAQIKKLKPGTVLKLNWEHRYITRTNADGTSAKFPRRVITLLKTSALTPPK